MIMIAWRTNSACFCAACRTNLSVTWDTLHNPGAGTGSAGFFVLGFGTSGGRFTTAVNLGNFTILVRAWVLSGMAAAVVLYSSMRFTPNSNLHTTVEFTASGRVAVIRRLFDLHGIKIVWRMFLSSMLNQLLSLNIRMVDSSDSVSHQVSYMMHSSYRDLMVLSAFWNTRHNTLVHNSLSPQLDLPTPNSKLHTTVEYPLHHIRPILLTRPAPFTKYPYGRFHSVTSSLIHDAQFIPWSLWHGTFSAFWSTRHNAYTKLQTPHHSRTYRWLP